MLFDKATEVELVCYEDTNFYNTYTLAIKETDTRISSVLDNVSGILFAAIAAIYIFIFMYTLVEELKQLKLQKMQFYEK